MISRYLAALLLLLAFALPARAEHPVFHEHDGAAIGGYDTVAYFLAGRAVPGRPDIEVEWKGAMWRFSTASNREVFEANPRAYAPQYGGYCAYGVAKGVAVGADPTRWKIVDGKLYLMHSDKAFGLWSQDIAGNLNLSDAQWPAVLSK